MIPIKAHSLGFFLGFYKFTSNVTGILRAVSTQCFFSQENGARFQADLCEKFEFSLPRVAMTITSRKYSTYLMKTGCGFKVIVIVQSITFHKPCACVMNSLLIEREKVPLVAKNFVGVVSESKVSVCGKCCLSRGRRLLCSVCTKRTHLFCV